MRSRAVTVGAALVLLLTALTSSPALAEDPRVTVTSLGRIAAVEPEQADQVAAQHADEMSAQADKYGISEATAQARLDARLAANDLVVASNTMTDVFTGSYFTQDKDSYVLHLVTKEGVAVPNLDVPKSDALSVVWQTAPRSGAELTKLQLQLNADVDPAWFVSTGRNLVDGRIILTVTKDADVVALTAKYGDFADIEVGEKLQEATCSARDDCTPWRGGIYVHTGVDSHGILSYCTYGFSVRWLNNGVVKWITADHCQYETDFGGSPTWSHGTGGNSTVLGTPGGHYWDQYGDFARVSRPAGSTPRNYVYLSDAQKTYTITGQESQTSIANGDSVHLTGESTGDDLTTITDNWYCWTGSVQYHSSVSVCGAKAGHQKGPGDSGGPDYYNGLSMAINSATGSGFTAISFIGLNSEVFGAGQLNFNVCINSACDI